MGARTEKSINRILYFLKRYGKGGSILEFFIAIGVVVIAISCLSIDGKLKKTNEQNKEIIELLKKDKGK